MKKWYLFLLWIPLFSFGQKEGQELIDSLLTVLPKMKNDSTKVKTLNDLSYNYQYIDPKSGQKYANDALTLSKKIRWNDGIAESYRSLGINYSVDSDFEKSLLYYGKALKSTSNKKILSKVLRSTGLIYTYQSDYKNAMDFDMRALKMSEEVGDKKGVAAVLSNIGIIYYDLQNYRKAIEHYDKARKINEEMGNKAYLSNNLGNLANGYSALKEYDKAIEYYKKAIVINDELGDIGNKSINVGALGGVYFKQKKYDETLAYTLQSLKLSTEINDDRNMAHAEALIGEIYYEKSKQTKNEKVRIDYLEKAKGQFYKALPLDIKLHNLKEISTDYQSLANVEALLNNHKQAFELFQTAVSYKDSVFNEDSKETIKNLEDKRAIELRDKKIQLNKVTLESKEKQKWFYIFGILLFAIIGILLFYQSKNRKKSNEKLQLLNSELDQANKVKARFFSILNHDLRSPVSSLIQFLHLQKDSPELLTKESRIRMENKTISSAENLLESMEDLLLWSKGQMENFTPQFKNTAVSSIFEDLDRHFASIENIKIYFENPENLSVHTDENYLKTILRNLTGNAIKALEKTPNATIILKAFRQDNQNFILVSDNGPGGTQQQFRALYDEKEVVGIKTGLGLHLIRDLAKAINSKITVDTNPGNGTIFTILIP
ncbi:hypothetical protein FNO01nite_22280 [Flavobacterium noncentrifugens]|uniref:histidine kinase n=1 Tax=Flavobacterium noncentrifugens TaxID=1128970 RepID=A0A1G9ARH6_9FLAO|nr:tetratricopeptide repeat protein [Flavobacterium noncentrifugens]GEP51556.1 hypothetical protein FNO01nite_22280 [Flavobacterium noncentrifugens]SDK29843.1 Histidine kinase-, DNA gyrase B-, and HSP90-like ATPase [Flavobacterium noncentrifugens]